MPKKKIEPNEVKFPAIKEFKLGDDYEGISVVNVWCDGRDYDPDTEAYRPQYAFSIITPKWRYDGNNIKGANNELPDLDLAAQTLFATLYASQESYKLHLRGAFTDGNHEMYAPQVNEWAAHFSEEIAMISNTIAVQNQVIDELDQ